MSWLKCKSLNFRTGDFMFSFILNCLLLCRHRQVFHVHAHIITKISDTVCRTVLRKCWYPPTATMNFLRNPSTHFFLFTSNSYDQPPKNTFCTLVPKLRSRRHHPSSTKYPPGILVSIREVSSIK